MSNPRKLRSAASGTRTPNPLVESQLHRAHDDVVDRDSEHWLNYRGDVRSTFAGDRPLGPNRDGEPRDVAAQWPVEVNTREVFAAAAAARAGEASEPAADCSGAFLVARRTVAGAGGRELVELRMRCLDVSWRHVGARECSIGQLDCHCAFPLPLTDPPAQPEAPSAPRPRFYIEEGVRRPIEELDGVEVGLDDGVGGRPPADTGELGRQQHGAGDVEGAAVVEAAQPEPAAVAEVAVDLDDERVKPLVVEGAVDDDGVVGGAGPDGQRGHGVASQSSVGRASEGTSAAGAPEATGGPAAPFTVPVAAVAPSPVDLAAAISKGMATATQRAQALRAPRLAYTSESAGGER